MIAARRAKSVSFEISKLSSKLESKHPLAESLNLKQRLAESTSAVLAVLPRRPMEPTWRLTHAPDTRFGSACLAAMVTAEALLK